MTMYTVRYLWIKKAKSLEQPGLAQSKTYEQLYLPYYVHYFVYRFLVIHTGTVAVSVS